MKRLYYTFDGKFKEFKPVEECPEFALDPNYPCIDVPDEVEEQHIKFSLNNESMWMPVIESPMFRYPVKPYLGPASAVDSTPLMPSSGEIKADIANSLIAAAMNPETAEATRDYLKSLLKEVISEMNINSDDATKK